MNARAQDHAQNKNTARSHTVLILPEGIEVAVADGTPLLDVLRAHVAFETLCGGNGTCGKCRVDVDADGKKESVLACKTRVDADMRVVHAPVARARVLTHGRSPASAQSVFFTPPSPDAPLAAAFDIGTTTLVCSLLDQSAGRELAVCGAQNPQATFGADVMARLLYASEHGGSALQEAVVSGMNALLEEVCASAHVATSRITQLSAAGNSAMQTLLLGRSPASLTRPPYRPDACDAVTIFADALELRAGPDACLHLFPLIGGFVGGDTAACLLATAFDTLPGTTLLIDIGTNGELVLGNATRRIACSTAAGPAFEGALLHSGMRAADGAIDSVAFSGDALHVSVIGGGGPVGICGSGLVMLAACLLAAGCLEESGRLVRQGPLMQQVVTYEGQPAFAVTPPASDRPVLLTQKDIRALQLAKGAIAAGIDILMKTLGIAAEEIDCVLLAGAFGNVLDLSSACAIGLLPAALAPRTKSIGNAAIEGAKLAALHPEALARASELARNTAHVELAAAPDFQDRFIDALALRRDPLEADE